MMMGDWSNKPILRIATNEIGVVVGDRNGLFRVLTVRFPDDEYELLLPNTGGSGEAEKMYAWWHEVDAEKKLGEWSCFDLFGGPKVVGAPAPEGWSVVAEPEPVPVRAKKSRVRAYAEECTHDDVDITWESEPNADGVMEVEGRCTACLHLMYGEREPEDSSDPGLNWMGLVEPVRYAKNNRPVYKKAKSAAKKSHKVAKKQAAVKRSR